MMDRPGHPLQRKHALCARCGAAERQRVQWLLMHRLSAQYRFSEKTLLHFAPEPLFYEEFRNLFRQVTTTDIQMPNVDIRADIRRLPFSDGSFDVVFASHVLEHVSEDRQAMCEIRRVLRSGGLAIIEVPIVSEVTMEYNCPNPYEFGHVRAPGADYYERFRDLFSRVEIITSEDFPPEHQPFVYCNWTIFPTNESPLRRAMKGRRHPIVVALYHV
ncbi:MAG TPA: class I SAM-dependent methyltransferase [Anaerohalosphaeraceae bacterium]|nr:class I SAM-dependent methyltransferase [Anaerohalosphaeraceae bacterium]